MPNPLHPYYSLLKACEPFNAQLIAVTKNRKEKEIQDLYQMGQKDFGENKAQELVVKASLLPNDIRWHLIGHLQTNKVKHILPYVFCIQSLDSAKLWKVIDEQAKEAGININCLIQIKVAAEETKFGWEFNELLEFLNTEDHLKFSNVRITGVMGMASLTQNQAQVRAEFKRLHQHFIQLQDQYFKNTEEFKELSMGMSGDYQIALEEGSTMIRIGSLLFI